MARKLTADQLVARQIVDSLPPLLGAKKVTNAGYAERLAAESRARASGHTYVSLKVDKRTNATLHRLAKQLAVSRGRVVEMAVASLLRDYVGGMTAEAAAALTRLQKETGAQAGEVVDFALRYTLQQAVKLRRIGID